MAIIYIWGFGGCANLNLPKPSVTYTLNNVLHIICYYIYKGKADFQEEKDHRRMEIKEPSDY